MASQNFGASRMRVHAFLKQFFVFWTNKAAKEELHIVFMNSTRKQGTAGDRELDRVSP